MNTLSSLLEWIANTIGANPSTLKTTSKTLVGSINEIADKVYPVGCYYWTSDAAFNPQTAFGGTWEKMDEGMTLVCAGDTHTISAGTSKDGGSKDATLVSHNHSVSAISVPIRTLADCSGSGGKDLYYWNGETTMYLQVPAHSTSTEGSSASGANMMPYKNAFCWHRTA